MLIIVLAGTDLMDILKRRVNRIKKEAQVYIHKVHLLCWIAHGNHINNILGSEHLMAMTLSLLPSQQCFPPHRLNISYLEEILKWYKKNIKLAESNTDDVISKDILEEQIMQKSARGYKMFVYIFICLLRSLGVRCRLMLSLQVESLRPSNTELCSLKKEKLSDGASNTRKSTAKVSETPSGAAAQTSKTKTVTKVVSSKKTSQVKNILKKKNKLKVLKKLNFEDSCYLECSEKESCTSDSPQEPSQSKKSQNSNKNDIPLVKLAKRNKETKIEKTNESSNTATKEVNKKKPVGSVANQKGTAQKSELTKKEKISKNKDPNLVPKLRKSNAKDISSQVVKTKPNLKNLNCTVGRSLKKSDTAKFRNKDKFVNITTECENIFIPQVDGGNDDISTGKSKNKSRVNFDKLKSNNSNTCNVKTHPQRLKQVVHYREIDSDEDFVSSDISSKGKRSPMKNKVKSDTPLKSIKCKKSRHSENSTFSTLDVRNDIINLVKQSMSEEKRVLTKQRHNSMSSDSEYEPVSVKKKTLHKEKDIKVKRRIPMKKDLIEIERKRLIEKEEEKKKKGINVWAEVFAEAEEKWISVDVVKGQVHCVKEIYVSV